MNGRSLGETGEQFVEIAKSILTRGGQSGVSIDIRDSVIVHLHFDHIRGANSISTNISGLAQSGHQETAQALKKIAEAVTDCLQITVAQRSELLELLDELSKQAVLDRSDRAKPGVIKGILAALSAGLGAAGGLAEVWSTWGPAVQDFFGA